MRYSFTRRIRRVIINTLPRKVLALAIKIMEEERTKTEQAAEREYIEGLPRPTRVSPPRHVIGMVGLIGSGKSTTARMLAEHLGAIVLRGDDIRLILRKHGEPYEKTRRVAESVARQLAGDGYHVIIDTDFVDREKRVALEEAIGGAASVHYVRTIADPDVQFARIRHADYETRPTIYTVASTSSTADDKHIDVRLREFWRRTPRHFQWRDEGGGRWVLRDMPFVSETIATGHDGVEGRVELLAARVQSMPSLG